MGAVLCCNRNQKDDIWNEESILVMDRPETDSEKKDVLYFPSTVTISPKFNSIYEKDASITKKYILELIHNTLYTDAESYSIKVNTESVKMWLKEDPEKGDGMPLIKIVYNFDREKVSLEDLLKYLFNPEERLKWDKNIISYRQIDVDYNDSEYNQSHNIGRNLKFVHLVNKGPPMMKNRDFVEKRILFRFKSGYVYFCSSIPEQFCETNPKYIRAHTIKCGAFMRPIDDKTIQYIGFSQTDYQLTSVVPKLLNSFIPSTVKCFYKNCVDGIEKAKVSNEAKTECENILIPILSSKNPEEFMLVINNRFNSPQPRRSVKKAQKVRRKSNEFAGVLKLEEAKKEKPRINKREKFALTHWISLQKEKKKKQNVYRRFDIDFVKRSLRDLFYQEYKIEEENMKKKNITQYDEKTMNNNILHRLMIQAYLKRNKEKGVPTEVRKSLLEREVKERQTKELNKFKFHQEALNKPKKNKRDYQELYRKCESEYQNNEL